MRINRKGIVAVMDAMLFIVILGLVVSAMFVYAPDDPEEPIAEKVHNDIFATELRVNDVFDVNDSRVISIDYIIAAQLASGNGNIEPYLYELLRSMVPVSHGFELTCEYRGNVMIINESAGLMTSRYSSERPVAGDILRTVLTIF